MPIISLIIWEIERRMFLPISPIPGVGNMKEIKMNNGHQQSRDRHRRLPRHRRSDRRAARRRRLHRRHQLRRQRRVEAEALARKIEKAGGRAHDRPGRCQRSRPRCARMFDAAEAAFGGVDVLVNNAGIMKLATIADSDDALFEQPDRDQPEGHVQHAARSRASGCATAAASSTSRPASSALAQPTYGVYAATKAGGRGDDARSWPRNCAAATSRSTPSRRGRPRRTCSSTASRRK